MTASFEDALRELIKQFKDSTTKAELIEALDNVQADLEEGDDDDEDGEAA